MHTLSKSHQLVLTPLFRARQTVAAISTATMAFLIDRWRIFAMHAHRFAAVAGPWARRSMQAAARWTHVSAVRVVDHSRRSTQAAARWTRQSAALMVHRIHAPRSLAVRWTRDSAVVALHVARRGGALAVQGTRHVARLAVPYSRRVARAAASFCREVVSGKDEGFVINLELDDLLPFEDQAPARPVPPPLPRFTPVPASARPSVPASFVSTHRQVNRADSFSFSRSRLPLTPVRPERTSDIELLVRTSGSEARPDITRRTR